MAEAGNLNAFMENNEVKTVDATKKVRIGIIGCGGIAHAHMKAYLEQPDVEIVAGCDLVPGKAKAFFEKCFQAIPGFDPGCAVIVGDSLTSDIKGGINMGITTLWYNYRGRPPRPDIVPNYTVTELSAIPPLLDRIL